MPRARVRVRFTRPDFAFDGVGYHDVNARRRAARARLLALELGALSHRRRRRARRIVYAAHERGGAARALVVDARDDERTVARAAALLPEGERRPRRRGA